METPRLLSEYFAARAQSAERISAKADVDVMSAIASTILQTPRSARRGPDMFGMRASRRPEADG